MPKISGPLTSRELTNTHRHLIKSIQCSAYPKELAYLLKKQSKCPPLVRQLCLFTDDNHLICCGGRIHNAPTTELSRFPYLLPSNCRFTDMIVMDTHNQLHHGGVSVTITALRQVYWISSIQQYVRKLLRHVTCNKLMGKPYRAPDPLHSPRYVSPIHHPLQSLMLILLVPYMSRKRMRREKYTIASSHVQLHKLCTWRM